MVKMIYQKIGEIIEMVQYIEYNLAEYFDLDHTWTTGQLANKCLNENLLNEEEAKKLEVIVEKRNHLVHQFFKEIDFYDHLNDGTFLEKQDAYLRKFLKMVQMFNKHILNITS